MDVEQLIASVKISDGASDEILALSSIYEEDLLIESSPESSELIIQE